MHAELEHTPEATKIIQDARAEFQGSSVSSQVTLHPTPYTLHPTPYSLHPTPYTLHPGLQRLVAGQSDSLTRSLTH